MKKLLLMILMVLATISPAFAVTNTFQSGGVDLNWSTTGNWDQGHVPLAGEDVVIPNLVAVMDVARIPATTGNIASLAATTGGQITLDLSAAGPCEATHACGVYVTNNIQAATKNTGFIAIAGDGTGNTLTLSATNLIGGTGSAASCIKNSATAGTVTVTGHVKGGTQSQTYGFHNASTCAVTVSNGAEGGSGATSYGFYNASTANIGTTGDVTGGTGTSAYGFLNASTGTVTLTNSNLINGTGGIAFGGKPPAWSPGYTNYLSWYDTGAGTARTFYFDTDPGVANVKLGTTYYFQSGTIKTGTMSGGGGTWGF